MKIQRLICLLISFSVLGSLAACGQSQAAQSIATTNSIATVGSSSTNIRNAPATDTPANIATEYAGDFATKAAGATIAAHNRAAFFTAIALSPPPTYTPGLPPVYPSSTPWLGMGHCIPASVEDPMPRSCWQGYINGQLVLVKTGVRSYDPNDTQGLIWAMLPHQHDRDVPLYPTPQKIGPVRIVAVDGSRFTVASVDPQIHITFIFDLATHQWVAPTPQPSPSPGVSPSP